MKRYFFLAFVLAYSTICHAEEQLGNPKIMELMEITGTHGALLEWRKNSMARAQDMGAKAKAQLLGRFGANANEKEILRAVDSALAKFRATMESAWSVEQAVATYAETFAANLSDKDIEQLIVFYKSPLGQRALEANISAQEKMNSYITERSSDAFNYGMQQFNADLYTIANKR